MRFSILSTIIVAVGISSAATVSNIVSFPLGTWAENIALRSNGQLLVTSLFNGHLWQVDPSKQKPAYIVTTIPNRNSFFGITEVEEDVFYVNVGFNNASDPAAMPYPYATYRIDVSQYVPGGPKIKAERAAVFPKAGILNGATTVNAAEGILLLADSLVGVGRRLKVETRGKKVTFDDVLTHSNTTSAGGSINGVKIKDGYLYWSNNGRGLIARAPISPQGEPTGPSEIFVGNAGAPDDFCLQNSKRVVGYSTGEDKLKVFRGRRAVQLAKGNLLKGSTACVVAPGGKRVYVSTSGGADQYSSGKVTVPGKVVAVDL